MQIAIANYQSRVTRPNETILTPTIKGTMQTALQTKTESSLETVNLPIDIAWPDLQAAISGNLARLSAEGQVKYYNALCKFTGLNPLGFPFEWITFQGKLKLYPKKECADQLRGVHKISAKIISREFFDDICMVRVISTMPDGREFESTGAVPYAKTMPALERCKALKVAETQAYRRGTFGLVGLGNLPDDDAIDTPRTQVETVAGESVDDKLAKLNALNASPEKTVDAEVIPQKEPEAPSFVLEQPAPPVQAVVPQVETPVQPGVSTLSDDEVAKVMEVLNRLPDQKRAIDYLIYRGWLQKGANLNTINRTDFEMMTATKNFTTFKRYVESWKGTL